MRMQRFIETVLTHLPVSWKGLGCLNVGPPRFFYLLELRRKWVKPRMAELDGWVGAIATKRGTCCIHHEEKNFNLIVDLEWAILLVRFDGL